MLILLLVMLLLVVEHLRCCVSLISLLLFGTSKGWLMTATPLTLWVMVLKDLIIVTQVVMLLRKRGHSGDLANGLFERFDSRLSGSLVLASVEVHDFGLLLTHQVILWIVCAQLVLIILPVINPFQLHRSLNVGALKVWAEVCQGAHLSVNKGVS